MKLITKIKQAILSYGNEGEDDSMESRRLDFKLRSLCQEWRHSEENQSPKLSSQFEARLLHRLQESASATQKTITFPSLVENRQFQYGLSLALAMVLVLVVSFRIPTSENSTSISQDKTSVLMDNSSYLNQPSSVSMPSNPEVQLLEKIRDNSGAVDVLLNLEQYYYQVGKVSTASEIHKTLDAVNLLSSQENQR